MRRSSPRKLRIAIVLLAGLGLAAVAGAGSAAEGTAARGEIIELIRLEVRPGQEAAMERFLARLAEGARRTGAAIRWRVHRRVDGERPLYVIVLRATSTEQLEAWGDLTASATLEQAFGADEARRLLALREHALLGLTRERFVPVPALGFDG